MTQRLFSRSTPLEQALSVLRTETGNLNLVFGPGRLFTFRAEGVVNEMAGTNRAKGG
jgi:hypothetical protein